MSNPANNLNLVGRLAAAPRLFTHKNGTSGTMRITIYAKNDYVTKSTGKRESVRLDLEQYINDITKLGLFPYMNKGDNVAISGHIDNSDHISKTTGQKVYGTKLIIDSISLLDSRSTSTQRAGRGQAQAVQAQQVQQAQPQAQQVQYAQVQAPAAGRVGQVVETINPNQAVQSVPAPAQMAPAMQAPVQPAPEPFNVASLPQNDVAALANDAYAQAMGAMY